MVRRLAHTVQTTDYGGRSEFSLPLYHFSPDVNSPIRWNAITLDFSFCLTADLRFSFSSSEHLKYTR